MKFPSKRDIMNSKPIQGLIKWANTNTGAKIIILSLIWLVVSIPFDLYLLVRWGIGPSGFWEEIALILVAILCIGWLQGILIFLGIFVSIALLLEDFYF